MGAKTANVHLQGGKSIRAVASERTYTLAESQLNVIEMALEQIEGLVTLIKSHDENVDQGIGTISALNLIEERARWCAIFLRAGYAEPKRLRR